MDGRVEGKGPKQQTAEGKAREAKQMELERRRAWEKLWEP